MVRGDVFENVFQIQGQRHPQTSPRYPDYSGLFFITKEWTLTKPWAFCWMRTSSFNLGASLIHLASAASRIGLAAQNHQFDVWRWAAVRLPSLPVRQTCSWRSADPPKPGVFHAETTKQSPSNMEGVVSFGIGNHIWNYVILQDSTLNHFAPGVAPWSHQPDWYWPHLREIETWELWAILKESNF